MRQQESIIIWDEAHRDLASAKIALSSSTSMDDGHKLNGPNVEANQRFHSASALVKVAELDRLIATLWAKNIVNPNSVISRQIIRLSNQRNVIAAHVASSKIYIYIYIYIYMKLYQRFIYIF